MEGENLSVPDAVSKEPNYHAMNTVEACSFLETCMQKGLATNEVTARRRRYGWNKLEKEKSTHPIFIYLNQFFDPVIYVLLVAASLAFIFGELLEAVAVMVVILITTLIGFFMEWRATRSMDALRQMAQTTAWVCRDGVELQITAEEIVPGDILLLKMGDMISADARLLEYQNLMVKEAALTGESTAVSKQELPISVAAQLADRNNMLYKGTIVSKGRGRAVVTATGESTELGKINRITREVEVTQTPLERNLSRLSRQLIWLTIALSVVIALAGYTQGRDMILMIETAVALAIAAIPEGLPIVATIALARGMQRMAKKDVIIKKLESVQTLGETSVICTDKTGTLTENEMAVHSLALPKRFLTASSHKDSKSLDSDVARLLRSAVLCNDALQEQGSLVGDPEEVALVRFAETYGYDRSEMLLQYPKVWENPFDTETRSMATGHNIGERFLLCVKGAWESLEPNFDFISDGKEGQRPFKDKARWNMEVDKLAAQGLRTMAFAERISDKFPEAAQTMHGLTFLGLVGFIDPPRTDVRHAIATCHKAGIKVVMVTGDHPQTARKIAVDTGLIAADSEMDQVMVGSHLAQLADLKATKEDQLRDVAVFARVSPAQKLDLIEYYQRQHHTVGMTGDGINDAPALKKADIGIAMGIRGTEAAKEVSDVILKNDQFTAIELAIRQGRIIFENIRNFVVFLLSCNLAEILSVTMAALSNLPLPLLPLQILYLNLVTDVFPALALGIGEGNKDIMRSPPRDPKESIVPKALWQSTVVYGLCITSGVIGISIFSYYHLKLPAAQINNLAFYTLVLGQLLNIFNLPERTSSFFDNEVTRNPWVWASLVLCLGLTAIGYLIPVLREALSLVPLDLTLLIWVVAFSLGTLLLTQLIKRLGGTV